MYVFIFKNKEKGKNEKIIKIINLNISYYCMVFYACTADKTLVIIVKNTNELKVGCNQKKNNLKLPIVHAKPGRMFRPRPFYIYYFDSGSKGQVCLLFKVRVANFIILVNVTPCQWNLH